MFEWLLFEFSFSMIRSLHLVQDVYCYLINTLFVVLLEFIIETIKSSMWINRTEPVFLL